MAIPVCIETPTRFARYTVADDTAIPLSTILKLSGANTAAAVGDENFVHCAGFAWEEKTASDGITEISTALNGVWDVTMGDTAALIGVQLALSGANAARQAVLGDLISGAAIGKVLETGTATTAVRVRLDL